MAGAKQEFPPLLPLGFHPVTLFDLERMCVDAFPLSSTRADIMSGLRTFVQRLVDSSVVGELWIDGGFLTEKIDPCDVDVVLRVGAGLLADAFQEQKDAIRWVIDNQKKPLKCDSYVQFEYPPNDPLYTEGEWWRTYWHAKWGFSRIGDPKGIAVLSLPGGTL